MSGHSKWHNIQKTKGAADAKRAQAFTKIAREMIVAVKEGGGGDPRSNSKLAAVIAKAKAANMPNDNIKRTIDKALGAGNTENYEKIVYEGYGPCGVAVIVETMTDNRNRTAGEIRHYFDKYGGNMGAANCVSWSFDKKGVIVIDNEDEELDEDTVMMDALEAGAADFEADDDVMTVYTGVDDVATVADALTAAGYKLLSAQVEMLPATSSSPMRTISRTCRRCSTCSRITTMSRTSGITGKTRSKHLRCGNKRKLPPAEFDQPEVFYKAVYSVMLFVRINTELPQIMPTIHLDHFRFKSFIEAFPENSYETIFGMRNKLLLWTDRIRKIAHIDQFLWNDPF